MNQSFTRPHLQDYNGNHAKATHAVNDEIDAQRAKQSALSPASSEENLKTFPFLSLPGELRNIIYRGLVVLNFFGIESYFGKVELQFSAQPAITRVNKQVRAEALSIYYAENIFYMEIILRIPFSACYKPFPEVDYGDVYKIIGNSAPSHTQSPSIGHPLRHIRTFQALIYAQIADDGPYTSFHVLKFAKGENRDFMSEKDFGRLGGDETDWADLTIVDALVKQWMRSISPDSRFIPVVQEHLVHVLWHLGANLLSHSGITVMGTGLAD